LRKLLAWFIVLSSVAQRLFSADVTTTIPEASLNEFAKAVGSISGEGGFTYSVMLPKLVSVGEESPPQNNAAQESAQQQRRGAAKGGPIRVETATIAPHHVVWQRYDIQTGKWQWRLEAPRFAISPSGVSFFGDLIVTQGSRSWIQPVQLPVTVQFNSAASHVEFTVSNDPITVQPSFGAGAASLGSVWIGSNFSTYLPVNSNTFTVGGRAITGTVVNVGIQYLSGSIRITNNVQF
jgi:hypothetical protein